VFVVLLIYCIIRFNRFLKYFFGQKASTPSSKTQTETLNTAADQSPFSTPADLKLSMEFTQREKVHYQASVTHASVYRTKVYFQIQIGLVRKLVLSYFNIVSKTLQDSCIKVPYYYQLVIPNMKFNQAIWFSLVNPARLDLQRTLVSELYRDELQVALLEVRSILPVP